MKDRYTGYMSSNEHTLTFPLPCPLPRSSRDPGTACIAEDSEMNADSAGGNHWLRFNDVLVDEFSMDYVALESECFGGTYKPKPGEENMTYCSSIMHQCEKLII